MAEKNNYYGSGIFVAGNIDIGAIGKPADSRVMVPNLNGLAELVADKRVYDGMIVYCESTKTYHKCSVEWDSSMNITSSSWKQVEIQSLDELKALIAQESTAAMEFKGAIKDGVLPTLEEGKNYDGNLYKVATKNVTVPAALNAEEEVEVVAKPGDSLVCEGGKWYLIPSGDDIENTWRAIKVNGVEKLGGGITTGDVDFVQGDNVTITEAAGVITIAAQDTHYESKLVAANSATDAEDETAEAGQVHLNLVENGEVKSSHKIVGAGGITVTHTKAEGEDGENVITIEAPEGAKYDLAAKTENNEAVLSLAGTDNTEDKVAIVGNDAVAVTVDGGKIKVSAHDTKYTGSNGDEIKVGATDDGAITAELTEAVRTKLNKVWEEVGIAEDLVDDLKNDYIGTFTHDTAKTVVDYINAKTDGIATSGNLEALGQRVTAVEKDINDNRAAWLKDDNDNTTYQFSIPASGNDKGKLLVEKKEIGESAWTKVGAYDVTTPDELAAALVNYYTKEEVNGLIPTELGVMSVKAGNDAIEIGGTAKEPTVGVKLNPTQGNVVLSVDGGLKAQVDLSHNHDDIYKKKQTAVVDPTANGNSLTFIDTISQNEQGVITVTKKTVGKVANATHADSADTATNAGHAGTADTATNAGHAEAADHASTADEAAWAEGANRANTAGKVEKILTVKVGGVTKQYDGSADVEADVDAAIEAAIDEIPAAPVYSLKKAADSGAYAAVYNLTKDGEIVGDTINIPKDMVVESGKVVENPTGQAAGTYIELKLQNVTNPLYINVGSLIEYVTSGSKADDAVVVAVDSDHKVTATLTDGKITLAKLEKDVQDAIALAKTALQAADIVGKADKVSGATAGNFAGLDANGNLTDSGVSAEDLWDNQENLANFNSNWEVAENGVMHSTIGGIAIGPKTAVYTQVTDTSFKIVSETEPGETTYGFDSIYSSKKGTFTLPAETGTLLTDKDEKLGALRDSIVPANNGTIAADGWAFNNNLAVGQLDNRIYLDNNNKTIVLDNGGNGQTTYGQSKISLWAGSQSGELTLPYKTGTLVVDKDLDAYALKSNYGANASELSLNTPDYASVGIKDGAITFNGGVDTLTITNNSSTGSKQLSIGDHGLSYKFTANGGTSIAHEDVAFVSRIQVGTGLKAETKTNAADGVKERHISIDEDVVFVLDCN